MTSDKLSLEQLLGFVYPTFQIIEGIGIIPRVLLPPDFKKLVPLFYKQGRKSRVERYANDLMKMMNAKSWTGGLLDINLQWDNEKGLTNISVGIQGGYDLVEDGFPCFQEHNLGGENGYAAGFIAMQYVSELLKSKP
jgi:hypothetical protein